MHYYQHNIGDYRSDTSHLSLLEHGVYRQLLDWYYLSEEPIPEETDLVMRRLAARTEEEKKAVTTILNEFFSCENGWVHGRCEREILAYKAKADRARENGKLGGRRAKTKVVNSRNPEITGSQANHKPLTTNQEPITKDQNTSVDAKAPTCPHLEIIGLYNRILPELAAVIPSLWDGARKTNLLARWKQDQRHQSLEFWERFFTALREHPFYLGDNDRGWRADLGWLIEKKNFAKLIEKFVAGKSQPLGGNHGQQNRFGNSGGQRPDTSAAGRVRENIARARAERATLAGIDGVAVADDVIDVRPQMGEQLRSRGGPGQGMGELLEGDYCRTDQTWAEPVCN